MPQGGEGAILSVFGEVNSGNVTPTQQNVECKTVMSLSKQFMSTPAKNNSSGSKQWTPAAGAEARKLGNSESDWNFAGGSARMRRTRGPKLQLNVPPTSPDSCSPCNERLSSTDDDGSALSSLTDDQSAGSESPRKPPQSRIGQSLVLNCQSSI